MTRHDVPGPRPGSRPLGGGPGLPALRPAPGIRVTWNTGSHRDESEPPAWSGPVDDDGRATGGIAPDEAPRWDAPAPAQVPELRRRLLDHTRSDMFVAQTAANIEAGGGTIIPTVPELTGTDPSGVSARLLQRLEADRLADAAPWYVGADMTALACALGATPPGERMRMDRAPSESGLMVFQSPIGGYTSDLSETLRRSGIMAPMRDRLLITRPIVAAAWSPWHTHDIGIGIDDGDGTAELHPRWALNAGDRSRPITPGTHGMWLTLYTESRGREWAAYDPEMPVARDLRDGQVVTAGRLASFRAAHPLPLCWDNEILLTAGAPFDDAPPDSTQEWGQIVYTAWQLIRQAAGKRPVAEVTELPANRATRKRDARSGIADSRVRVVNIAAPLRPRRADRDADEAASNGRRAPRYSCRWPVPPYRRMTCMNPPRHADGECEHEEQIVGFSLRGPEGAPLKVSDRVNLWDHMPGADGGESGS